MSFLSQTWFINSIYLVAVIFFILGLKRLGSPRTARQGNLFSMLGMGIAIVITLFNSNILSFEFIIFGIVGGAIVGTIMAKKVAMTSMPEMVALFNGFGGLASALVALAEYFGKTDTINNEVFVFITLILSVLIGSITFSGSLVAFLKLREIISGNPMLVFLSKPINIILFLGAIYSSIILYQDIHLEEYFLAIVSVGVILGVTLVIPIGGADMPVVVSLLNSYSGIAVAMTGFLLKNNALIVVGSLVGASGIILTNIMCKAMNRSLLNVLFGGFGASAPAGEAGSSEIKGTVKSYSADEAGMILDVAEKIIIVPGYGMAVSQAQHVVKKISDMLQKRNATVSFAIHPVAGRMPGHMNVLLAEAGVEYDILYDMDQINDQFALADVAIVIGANDVVNPAAKTNPSSPIYGMPVLNVEQAKTVMVLKRSMNPGFAKIENELFYQDNTMMIFGDAKKTVEGFIQVLDDLD